jgi:hypothetical protein
VDAITQVPDAATYPCGRTLDAFTPQQRRCSGTKRPVPGSFLYSEEFGKAHCYTRCDVCSAKGHPVWALTDEEYYQIFGHTQAEFVPEPDPDEHLYIYRFWCNEHPHAVDQYQTVLEIGDDYDLGQFVAGEATVEHVPTGARWDVPQFLSEHVHGAGVVHESEADPFRFVAVPAEARQVPCACGGDHLYVVNRSTLHVGEGNGAAHVGLECPDGGQSSVHCWTITDAEFRATFE